MNDAAFREALEEYVQASDDRKWFGSDLHTAPLEVLEARKNAALARVLALYAERQGEVYEATDIHNRHGIRVRVIKVPPQEFGVGDRVRVTKVEEAK